MADFFAVHTTYAYMLPLLIVAAAGLVMLAVEMLVKDRRSRIVAALGVASLLVTAALCYAPISTDASGVSGFVREMVSQDAYARFFDLIFCATGIVVILLTVWFKPLNKHLGEYYALVLLCTTAFMFLASSVNLLMVYLCIEFVGVCSYILAAYLKDDPKSNEGAIKYLLVGSVAAAFMVYGMSLLYGFTGSLNIYEIGAAIGSGAPTSKAALAAFVLVFVGFGFKVALVPFHMWAPEAYEGAPTPITAFFSTAPKAAGIAVMIRVVLAVFPTSTVNWVPILVVLSIVTMTAGNVIAIWQTNVKRMMAYSSIAHVGYMLMGLIVAGSAGLDTQAGRAGIFATMFYVAVYALTNLGAFTAVIIASNALGTDNLSSYNGLGRRAPFTAVCLAFLLLSLGGVPPTAGFIGKFFLFMASINSGFYILAFFLAANSVISVFYYWMVVRRMFIDEPTETFHLKAAVPLTFVLTAASAAVLALAIFFQPLMTLVQKSLM